MTDVYPNGTRVARRHAVVACSESGALLISNKIGHDLLLQSALQLYTKRTPENVHRPTYNVKRTAQRCSDLQITARGFALCLGESADLLMMRLSQP